MLSNARDQQGTTLGAYCSVVCIRSESNDFQKEHLRSVGIRRAPNASVVAVKSNTSSPRYPMVYRSLGNRQKHADMYAHKPEAQVLEVLSELISVCNSEDECDLLTHIQQVVVHQRLQIRERCEEIEVIQSEPLDRRLRQSEAVRC